MGSSMGGLTAFVQALSRPDVFGGAACLSSSFWYMDSDDVNAFEFVRSHAPDPDGSPVRWRIGKGVSVCVWCVTSSRG